MQSTCTFLRAELKEHFQRSISTLFERDQASKLGYEDFSGTEKTDERVTSSLKTNEHRVLCLNPT